MSKKKERLGAAKVCYIINVCLVLLVLFQSLCPAIEQTSLSNNGDSGGSEKEESRRAQKMRIIPSGYN